MSLQGWIQNFTWVTYINLTRGVGGTLSQENLKFIAPVRMQFFCFQRNKRRFGNIWLISSTLIDFFNHFNYSGSNPALSYGIIVWLVSTNVRFDAGFKRTSSDWAKPMMIIFTATSRSYWKNRKNDSYIWLNQCMTAKSAGELLWTKTSPKFVWQTLWKEKENWNYHFFY